MTTGCLVRVTVTAAVYPCLVVSHHVDMQSTGQKSCCFSTLSGQRNALFQQNIGFPLPVPVRGQNSPWQRVFAFFPTIRKHLAKAFFRKSILQKHLAKHFPAKAFCKSICAALFGAFIFQTPKPFSVYDIHITNLGRFVARWADG